MSSTRDKGGEADTAQLALIDLSYPHLLCELHRHVSTANPLAVCLRGSAARGREEQLSGNWVTLEIQGDAKGLNCE